MAFRHKIVLLADASWPAAPTVAERCKGHDRATEQRRFLLSRKARTLTSPEAQDSTIKFESSRPNTAILSTLVPTEPLLVQASLTGFGLWLPAVGFAGLGGLQGPES